MRLEPNPARRPRRVESVVSPSRERWDGRWGEPSPASNGIQPPSAIDHRTVTTVTHLFCSPTLVPITQRDFDRLLDTPSWLRLPTRRKSGTRGLPIRIYTDIIKRVSGSSSFRKT